MFVVAFSRMRATLPRLGALATCLAAGVLAISWRAETKAAGSWDQKAAAAYLDRREAWWSDWPKAARDHETFCVSCHTAVPYALARPALRGALAEDAPSPAERKLLESVTRRVRLWNQVAPFYTDADRGAYKSAESRGTESVLNALILAARDARSSQLTADARAALAHMWAEQQTSGSKKGAWSWLRFANEPFEADDSDFYGATLAAVAAGTAPENYRSGPEIQENLAMLREYLRRESAAQPAVNRVSLLWASAKLPGLLAPDEQRTILQEVFTKQQSDGGWSLSSLVAGWKRTDGTPQETSSDGYATGLITLTLQQVGIPRENPQLQQGIAWLARNQNKTEGSWPAYSLNRNEAHHQSPQTALFMTDSATAYAVLALTEASPH